MYDRERILTSLVYHKQTHAMLCVTPIVLTVLYKNVDA